MYGSHAVVFIIMQMKYALIYEMTKTNMSLRMRRRIHAAVTPRRDPMYVLNEMENPATAHLPSYQREPIIHF